MTKITPKCDLFYVGGAFLDSSKEDSICHYPLGCVENSSGERSGVQWRGALQATVSMRLPHTLTHTNVNMWGAQQSRHLDHIQSSGSRTSRT